VTNFSDAYSAVNVTLLVNT